MKLSNMKMAFFIALISATLIGLVIVQSVLLKTALKSEEETFRSDVISALNKVTGELSSYEAKHAVLQIEIDDFSFDGKGKIIKKNFYYSDSSSDSSFIDSLINQSKEFRDYKTISGKSQSNYDSSKHDTTIYILQRNNSVLKSNKELFKSNSIGYSYTMLSDGDSISVISQIFGKDSSRAILIWAAIEEMKHREHMPIEDRIVMDQLDSSLSLAFQEAGIDLSYSFGVIDKLSDSVVMSTSGETNEQLLASPFTARLFPFEFSATANQLSVHFPDKQFYIYGKLAQLIIPTSIFLLIIISCFVYSIRIIIKQHHLAHRLRDFINNMTHEFKTPISTIQLAAEAIQKSEVIKDPSQLTKFNEMILSENQRMKNQVQKILQIATLEEGDYDFKRELLDIHKIIENAIEMFHIRIATDGGRISSSLSATNYTVEGDKVHLTNIIHNLIDNAMKYSRSNRTITVSTENEDSRLVIRIRDDGIGIDRDDLKHVFDKYFRVSYGDIHNVKGFGLGLSYVKMMTEAHGGKAEIRSSFGKGTEVTINLPLSSI